MKRSSFSFLIAIVAAASISMLSCSHSAAPKPYKVNRLLMGTLVELTLVGSGDRVNEAASTVLAEIQRVEDLTSFHKPSGLTALNDHAGKGPCKVDPELFALIEKSLRQAHETDGAFDPTIGPLSRAWNFSGEEPRLPDGSEIALLLPKVGWNLVKLDTNAGTVELPVEGMALDLGGIAKGYALDRVRDVLKKYGINNALVNAGGDVLALGEKEPGRPWRIGVQDPRVPTGIRAIVNLKDKLIVTSGDYERFFIKDGRRYHHILNPRTGFPAGELCSVTLIRDLGPSADGLSLAVFVLGPEKGLKLVESLPGVEGLFIDVEGRVSMTSGAAAMFELKP